MKAEAKRRGIVLPPKAKKAEIEALLQTVTVRGAVESDLAELAKRDPHLPATALAASALELARQMDDPENSATAKSMCSRALTEVLDRLAAQAPAKAKGDRIDELAQRRASRRSA